MILLVCIILHTYPQLRKRPLVIKGRIKHLFETIHTRRLKISYCDIWNSESFFFFVLWYLTVGTNNEITHNFEKSHGYFAFLSIDPAPIA